MEKQYKNEGFSLSEDEEKKLNITEEESVDDEGKAKPLGDDETSHEPTPEGDVK